MLERKKSLLLLSFPKSMSTLTYIICRDALRIDLSYPAAGEGILNHKCNMNLRKTPYYTRQSRDFRFLNRALESVLNKCGPCLLKDVVQPFFINRYLKNHSEKLNVLFIERPLADVVYCNWIRNWHYISKGVPSGKFSKDIDDMIAGITNVYNTIYSKFDTLEFNKLIDDERYIWDKLEDLGYRVNNYHYMKTTENFKETKEKVLRYRDTSLWKDIDEKIQNISTEQDASI